MVSEEVGGKTEPSISIADAIDRYLSECAQKNKPRTVQDYTRILNKYLPKSKLNALTRRSLMRDISMLVGVPSEQHHVFTCAKIFLNWCVKSGLLEANPIAGVTGVGKTKPSERVLDEEELALVWQKAHADNSVFTNIVALCILTGQRRGEIARLRWDYISED